MIVGVPKEIKDKENRVGLTPGGVMAFVKGGHKVHVETNAGAGIGISDKEYEDAGAKVLGTADEVF